MPSVKTKTKCPVSLRWTEIQTAAVPGNATVGLHALGLDIHRILVNSEPAEFMVREYPRPSLEVSAATTVKDVAEHAHSDYLAAVRLLFKGWRVMACVGVSGSLWLRCDA